MIRYYEIESANIQRIGFDPKTRALYIVFRRTGQHYVYKDVPASIIVDLLWADSPGKQFHKSIRRAFDGQLLGEGALNEASLSTCSKTKKIVVRCPRRKVTIVR